MALATSYLIQYGRPGFVGRFRAALPLARGDRVVFRGPRGIELGEVLLAPAERFTTSHDDGEILRAATDADLAELARLDAQAQELLVAAADMATASGLPLAFVDVETTLDGIVILHALPWDGCDATPLIDGLTARSGFAVRLLDLSRGAVVEEEPAQAGCGKPGCGSEGGGCSSCGTGSGGCSSGSCSRGTVKSADELTAYFADLREKMEAAGMARTPLN